MQSWSPNGPTPTPSPVREKSSKRVPSAGLPSFNLKIESSVLLPALHRFPLVVVQGPLHERDLPLPIHQNDRLLLRAIDATCRADRLHAGRGGHGVCRLLVHRGVVADAGDEDAVAQLAQVRLPLLAVALARHRVSAQHSKQTLQQCLLRLAGGADVVVDSGAQAGFALHDLRPRVVAVVRVAQSARLTGLSGQPDQAFDIGRAVGDDGETLVVDGAIAVCLGRGLHNVLQAAIQHAEAADVLEGSLIDETLSEVGGALVGVRRRGQPGDGDGAAAALVLDDGGALLAEVGQHGDAALARDAQPGAVDGPVQVVAAQDVRVRLCPPLGGSGGAVEIFLGKKGSAGDRAGVWGNDAHLGC